MSWINKNDTLFWIVLNVIFVAPDWELIEFFFLITFDGVNNLFELYDFLRLLLIDSFLLLKWLLKLNILLFKFVHLLFNHSLLNLNKYKLYIVCSGIDWSFLILMLGCRNGNEGRVDFWSGLSFDRGCIGKEIF